MPVPRTDGIEKKTDFEVRAAGWYSMVFNCHDERDAKDGKSKFAHVELEHTDGHGLAWVNLSFKDEALWKLDEFKKAIGMPSIETKIEDYYGTQLMVFLKVEIYEGEKKNVPTKYKPMLDAVPGNPKTKSEQGIPEAEDDLPF